MPQGNTDKEEGNYIENKVDWQDKITFGKGRAYGFELMLRKTYGKTSAWVAYTLSRSERKFTDLNKGNTFPYKYDRLHDISITISHNFTEKIYGGITWIFSTGKAFSFPSQKYAASDDNKNKMLYFYSSRNNHRMRAYHRLDLSINFSKEKRRGERVWSLGIYNVYNRKNPYFVYTKYKERETKLVEFSLFPIIPSISYSFKF